jgi:hypothetical protein
VPNIRFLEASATEGVSLKPEEGEGNRSRIAGKEKNCRLSTAEIH